MAWYNPTTWTPVDIMQGQGGQPHGGAPYTAPGGDTAPSPLLTQAKPLPKLAAKPVQAADTNFQSAQQSAGYNDPYAAERAAALSRAVESFNQGRDNVYESARSQVGSFVGNQKNNILDFIDSLRTGQQGIDRGRVKAQLGKERASDGIMGMVGRGIKSGATMLANKNAGDSSATGAIARAYGELGNRQQSDVNNQFGMENADLDVNQQALETQRKSGLRRFDTDQDNQVNGIVDQARQAFAALNEAATGAGIEERIAIAQEKEKIRNDVMSRLSVLDKTLRGASDVKAMGREGVLQEAGRLDQLGQGEASQYNFTDQAPVALQGGFQPGQLPIYSNRRREV